jgi:Fe-S cluster assembly protein SufD
MTQQVLTPGIAIPQSALDSLESRATESDWLRDARTFAWRAFESMDLPDPGDEEWRRTDVHGLPLEGMAPAPLTVTRPTVSAAMRARNVVVTDLAEAAQDSPVVRERLHSVVPASEWKYLALNAALWSNGTFIQVPDDVELDNAIHLQQQIAQADGAVFPRTLIVVGRNARAIIIDETHSSDGERSFVSGAVELVLGDGARVEYYNINRWGDGAYNFNTVRAVLGRDAEFTGMAAGVGSKLTKMRFDVQMPQPGARTQLLGVTYGSGDQHFDYNTLQNHVGDHTISDLQFKSALTDSASLVWYGITRITPTAGGSEANQTSRNLLLSEHASAAPIPILEIEAWDVSKCSHGATAGPVEEGELFYLQSRAIPKKIAEQMLVEGFFADVIDRVPSADVRARVMAEILHKMGGGAGERISFDEVLGAA